MLVEESPLTMLFVTLGSLGDIKPMIAIAGFAQEAGHRVKFATSPRYRRLVEEAGLRYDVFGSDSYFESKDVRDAIVHPRTGFGVFMWHANLIALEELHARLFELSEEADIMIATPLVMAAHLVAHQRQIPLVSCVLSPAMVLSEASAGTADPYRDEWRRRLNGLRREIGLPRRSFPQMERFSADLTLGVYPSYLSPGMGRYISEPLEVGYARLQSPPTTLNGELADWLKMGKFALFSFGSFVDRDAEKCFGSAVEACQLVGLRCLYVSKHSADRLVRASSEDVRIESFVEHSEVMPMAEVIVHHGGTGTLVESIRALRPVVIMPFGLDQIYNASRVEELGLVDVVDASSINTNMFVTALSKARGSWPRRKPLVVSCAQSDGKASGVKAIWAIESFLMRYRS